MAVINDVTETIVIPLSVCVGVGGGCIGLEGMADG